MPYAVFFNGGIAFHQGDVRSRSHGCIRLGSSTARTFFATLDRGDVVQVVLEQRPLLSVLHASRVGLPFPGTAPQNRLLSVAAHWTEVANGTARGCPVRRRPRRNGSVHTVSFALDGRSYEIDLSEDNAAKLRGSLAAFVAAARRSGGSGRRGRTARYPGKGRAAHPLQPGAHSRDQDMGSRERPRRSERVGSPRPWSRRTRLRTEAPTTAAGFAPGAAARLKRSSRTAAGLRHGERHGRSTGDPIRAGRPAVEDRRWTSSRRPSGSATLPAAAQGGRS